MRIEKPYGPRCTYRDVRFREEMLVVANVTQQIINHGLHPQFEYWLTTRDRVDVLIEQPSSITMVECKRRAVLPSDRKQAARYLSAAQKRWPDKAVKVILVAPELSPNLPPESATICYAAVA